MTIKQLVVRSKSLHERLFKYNQIGFPEELKTAANGHSDVIYKTANRIISEEILLLDGEDALAYFLGTVLFIQTEKKQMGFLHSFSDVPPHAFSHSKISAACDDAMLIQMSIAREFPDLQPIEWVTPAIIAAFSERQAEFDRIVRSKAQPAQQPAAKSNGIACNRNLLFATGVGVALTVMAVTAVAASAFSPYPSQG